MVILNKIKADSKIKPKINLSSDYYIIKSESFRQNSIKNYVSKINNIIHNEIISLLNHKKIKFNNKNQIIKNYDVMLKKISKKYKRKISKKIRLVNLDDEVNNGKVVEKILILCYSIILPFDANEPKKTRALGFNLINNNNLVIIDNMNIITIG
ncbi:hypothetical protein Hokovirus_1_142 [Hokovirus HKV1]|uniref:Uncharacterized protein n=1 Tax=Hokovirus HKV1 TaxID=1977638 RepID=A0A1V0SEW7_9VIRU|nr:hypothetical protein Hokovirus_1_142 [Hokovirus HKV1]